MRFLLLLFVCIALVIGCSEKSPQSNGMRVKVKDLDVNILEGYQPSQPIEFSHSIHSGENMIDCKYCHEGVSGKNSSGIPSTKVCLDCHETGKSSSNVGNVRESYSQEKNNPDSITSSNKNIVWTKVESAPIFEHAIHVEKGLSCNECHQKDMHAPLPTFICSKCHY